MIIFTKILLKVLPNIQTVDKHIGIILLVIRTDND